MSKRTCWWLMLTTGLWTAAAILAVSGSMLMDTRMMFWAVMTTMVAAVATGWLMANEAAKRERLQLEVLAQIMARAAVEEQAVKRLHKT